MNVHYGSFGNVCFGYCYSQCRWNLLLNTRQKRREGGLIMGAIIMSVLVSVIAVVGFIYFTYQDKKEALKNKK